MKVLDLFSGIGGFPLGLERAGMQTVAFCEIEPFCRAVLAKHWPGVPCYHDVREVTAERLSADGVVPDLICGGFPCQDISVAGRGGGLAGERSGLWFEMAWIIGSVKPRWVIIENSPLLRARGLERVLRSLDKIGYDAEWHCLPASAVGARHRRDRIWIVAHTRFAGLSIPQRETLLGAGWWEARGAVAECSGWASEPDVGRVVHGVPRRVDRLRALGNAVVPQIPELIGRAILAREAGCRARLAA